MKVKLLKQHTHEGKLCAVGDVIEVDVDISNWLANLKVATPVSSASSAPVQSVQSVHPVQPAPSHSKHSKNMAAQVVEPTSPAPDVKVEAVVEESSGTSATQA